MGGDNNRVKGAYNVLTRLAISQKNFSEEDKREIIFLYNEVGRIKVLEFAKTKKVIPFIAQLLCNMNIDSEYWDDQVEVYKKRNLTVIDVLAKIFVDFQNEKVFEVFVYENFGALLSSKTNIALFASGDVDLYADISHRNAIYRILQKHGFFVQNQGKQSEKVKTEFFHPTLLVNGFGINIMWTPMSRLKLPFPMDIRYCASINTLKQYESTEITVPSNEALLYLCLLHISIHSYSRSPDIRLYIDVVNMCKLNIDWHKVLEYAEHDHTIVRVLTASILTAKLLDVEIPKYVINYKSSTYSRQIKKILKLVYDNETNSLIYEPRGITVLQIEALSNDAGPIIGFTTILFPDKKWVKQFYVGVKGNIIIAYGKHILNLL